MDTHGRYTFIQLLSICILFLNIMIITSDVQKPQNADPAKGFIAASTPTPTPFNPFPYNPPEIPVKYVYLTMLVGDSIVGSLGPNAQLLRQHLIELYPNHEFLNYNYGFGSTSIETLPERLTKDTVYKEQNYRPILSHGFDLIIIESFGYNPLSKENEAEGLAKHMNILDESIKLVIKERPETIVAIMTPVAPNRNYLAKGVYDISTEERTKWANERIVYIESVIDYANENQIPLINIYEKSLTSEGDGDLKYINPDDYIHPSAEGVDLISRTIAQFIFDNKIFSEY